MRNEELLALALGEKLQRIRGDRGFTVSALAQRAGLAQDQLEAFEANREVPAVGDLAKLAEALDVSIGVFFQRALAEKRVEVVRAEDRFTVQPKSEAARTLNYRYQSLSYNLTDKLMSPFLVEIPPDESREAPTSSHQGEEFLFVLSGQLEVHVEGTAYRLAPGDSLYFDSRMPHSLRAVEGGLARVLACVAEDRRRRPDDDPMRRAHGAH